MAIRRLVREAAANVEAAMLDAIGSSSAAASPPPDPVHTQAEDLIAANTRFGAVDSKGLAEGIANASGDRTQLAAAVATALPDADKSGFVDAITVIAQRPSPTPAAPQHQGGGLLGDIWGGIKEAGGYAWSQAKDAGGVVLGAGEDLGKLALGVGRTATDLTLGSAADAAREAAGLVTGHTPSAPSWLPSADRGVQTLENAGKTLYTAATHPGAVWDGLKAPYEQDISQGRWGALAAQTVVDFGGLLDGESEAVDLARGASVADKIAEGVNDTERAANAVDHASEATRGLQAVTKEDLQAYRAKLGVADTQTVAVAKTDIPGLQNTTFEGASPKVLKEAGLPPAETGPIASPIPNPLFTRHAEEVISNQVVKAVERQGLSQADLNGRTLDILVSQPVCSACKAGLADPTASTGVLKQLSERYPGLTIHVGVDGSSESLTLLGGKIVGR